MMQADPPEMALIPTTGSALAAGLVAPGGRMRVICSWCRCELPAKACAPARDGAVSHGICPACRDAMLAAEGLPPLTAD